MSTLTSQDGTFLYTEPQSVIGLWWALEDCTFKNGCLWAVPGSHHQGVSRRFKRKDGNIHGGTAFEPSEAPEPYDTKDAVCVEVPAGSLVLLHNALVHYSLENRYVGVCACFRCKSFSLSPLLTTTSINESQVREIQACLYCSYRGRWQINGLSCG